MRRVRRRRPPFESEGPREKLSDASGLERASKGQSSGQGAGGCPWRLVAGLPSGGMAGQTVRSTKQRERDLARLPPKPRWGDYSHSRHLAQLRPNLAQTFKPRAPALALKNDRQLMVARGSRPACHGPRLSSGELFHDARDTGTCRPSVYKSRKLQMQIQIEMRLDGLRGVLRRQTRVPQRCFPGTASPDEVERSPALRLFRRNVPARGNPQTEALQARPAESSRPGAGDRADASLLHALLIPWCANSRLSTATFPDDALSSLTAHFTGNASLKFQRHLSCPC